MRHGYKIQAWGFRHLWISLGMKISDGAMEKITEEYANSNFCEQGLAAMAGAKDGLI